MTMGHQVRRKKYLLNKYNTFCHFHIFIQETITPKYLLMPYQLECGLGNSVIIATDQGLDGPGIESQWGEIFHPSRPALGPTQHAADHSPPSSAVVMKEQSYTSTHPLGHNRACNGDTFFTSWNETPNHPVDSVNPQANVSVLLIYKNQVVLSPLVHVVQFSWSSPVKGKEVGPT